jgi:putative FmdB family regulatory protein
MASYDYRCRECDTRFEVRRAISDDALVVACPQGHTDVARIWTAVGVAGRASAPAAAPAPRASGGCCGGGCH